MREEESERNEQSVGNYGRIKNFSQKVLLNVIDKKKTDTIKKYTSSFNSSGDPQHAIDMNRLCNEIENAGSEATIKFDTLKEKRSIKADKLVSESFHNNPDCEEEDESLPSHNSKRPSVREKETKMCLPLPQLDSKPDGCRKAMTYVPERHQATHGQSNNSHLDSYLRNHPMEKRVIENEQRFQKIMGKNKASVQNKYLKQKMCLMKNIETKFVKQEDKPNRPPPLPMSTTVINIKPEQCLRPSAKRRNNTSTSENKRDHQHFGVLQALHEVPKKRGNLHLPTMEEPRKKQKVEFEFNHVFKILDFFDKDESLKNGRKRIQEKMKDLGRDSFNDINSKTAKAEELSEQNFLQEYLVKGVLGKGSYGEVRLGIHAKTKEPFAVKIYPKKFLRDKIKRQNIQNERDILNQIDNEHIIKMYKAVEGVQSIYLVTEYAGRQSLHEVLSEPYGGIFIEDEARHVLSQLCKAILYLHQNGIVHRDIKLHNILVNDEKKLKLIDFGFALKLKEDELISVFCGTPSYMSPEIINRQPYDGKASDIWAFAVCAFRMVIGNFPFRGEVMSIHRRRIVSANREMQSQFS